MPTMDNAHAVVIGIANYDNIRKLPETVLKDVGDISGILKDQNICGYPSGNVKSLLDSQATQLAIRSELADLAKRTDANSTVFIYISSHGGQIEQGPDAGDYLLPVDVQLDQSVSPPQIVAKTAISGNEFTKALGAIAARKMVVVLDCCHSGGIGEAKGGLEPEFKTGLSDTYYEQLKTGRGRVIVASSRSDERSLILAGDENSLFTKYLLKGLRGDALGSGGVIRIFDLYNYVQPKVVADATTQHPFFRAALEENFPVALYLGGKAAAPAPPPMPADAFKYDVFISYRQQEPDRSWVRKKLLPTLEKGGLHACVDYRDFRLGAPLVTEMARAVEQSRYTLSILTPRYLESNFAELENVLAEHLGLEKSQRRLLAVMREECEPRLGMRARLWLDVTDDDEFDAGVARLVDELRQSPEK